MAKREKMRRGDVIQSAYTIARIDALLEREPVGESLPLGAGELSLLRTALTHFANQVSKGKVSRAYLTDRVSRLSKKIRV